MLVLSRKNGEELLIGDAIKVKVVGTGHNRVKIAIDAPDDVRICRAEVLEKIEESEVQRASNTKLSPNRRVHSLA